MFCFWDFKTGLLIVIVSEILARCLSHQPPINRRHPSCCRLCFGRNLDIQASGLAQGAASWSNFERLYHVVDYRMKDWCYLVSSQIFSMALECITSCIYLAAIPALTWALNFFISIPEFEAKLAAWFAMRSTLEQSYFVKTNLPVPYQISSIAQERLLQLPGETKPNHRELLFEETLMSWRKRVFVFCLPLFSPKKT